MTPALVLPTLANNLQPKLEAVQDQLAASSSPAFTPDLPGGSFGSL
jgi:hypothetical protein